jgi:hypothetical protein
MGRGLSGAARSKKHLADSPITSEQALCLIAKTLCSRLGPSACPFRGQQRLGNCVASVSPCKYDAREALPQAVVSVAQRLGIEYPEALDLAHDPAKLAAAIKTADMGDSAARGPARKG